MPTIKNDIIVSIKFQPFFGSGSRSGLSLRSLGRSRRSSRGRSSNPSSLSPTDGTDKYICIYIYIRALSSAQNKLWFILHEPYDLSWPLSGRSLCKNMYYCALLYTVLYIRDTLYFIPEIHCILYQRYTVLYTRDTLYFIPEMHCTYLSQAFLLYLLCHLVQSCHTKLASLVDGVASNETNKNILLGQPLW